MNVEELIEAYESNDPATTQEHKDAGCVLMVSALIDNGGLVGTIENLYLSTPQVVTDAPPALRRQGLDEFADLFEKAATEYLRMRPDADFNIEISEQDEELWDALDDQWYELDDDSKVVATVERKLASG